ncbi:unnamed protein product, partial [Closterium sp. NIES-64]
GRLNIELHGYPKLNVYFVDLFHTLVNMPLKRFSVVLVAAYAALFITFAIPFLAFARVDGLDCLPGVKRLDHAVWFTVQSSMSIGFGGDLTPHPDCFVVNSFVAVLSVVTLGFAYALLGVFYVNDKWGVGSDKWGAGNGERGMGSGEWGVMNGEWGMGSGEWERGMESGEWGAGRGEWGMGSGEWGVGNGEWGVGNGEWGMGSGEWGVGNGEWGMGSGEWGVGNGEWGVGNGEWGMGSGEWGVGNGEWGVGKTGEW